MTTLTKVNVYIKEGLDFLAELINRYYSYSTIGIIYELGHEEDFYAISKRLSKNGNRCQGIPLNRLESENMFAEHIRFVLGIGTKKMVYQVQKTISSKTFAFYCTEVCADYFTNGLFFDETCCFAQFAYFDIRYYGVQNTKVLKSGYTTLLSLLTGMLDLYCYRFIYPYRDVEMEVILEQQKDFIFNPVDKTKYMQSLLELIKRSVDYLSSCKAAPLIYKIRQSMVGDWSSKREFFLCYLLFYMGLIFTKWNINDMLIPSASLDSCNQLVTRVLLQQSDKIAQHMLNKAEINHIAMFFRAMGESFEDIDIVENISLIAQKASKVEGIFREINNIGVLEGIIGYEENTGY